MVTPLTSLVSYLLLSYLIAPARADEKAVREAIERGLKRIDQGAANYVKNASCYSCHHQAHAIPLLVAAKARGFATAESRFREQIDFTLETFRPFKEQILKGRGIPGGNTMAAYALLTLEQASHPRDEITDMLLEYLLVRQKPDGSWPALMKRPPSEGSSFTNAALVLRALRKWGGEEKETRKRIDIAFEKGKKWLVSNTPEDTEDRAFLLRGLIAARAEPKRIDEARDSLLKAQNEDGSWSQLPNLKGDAYATGLVLMSLRESGLPVDHAAYRKAVPYLVKTQQEDGSWLVTTRSKPVQKFFDNGDPHGKSQFISFAATGWALQALLETIPPR